MTATSRLIIVIFPAATLLAGCAWGLIGSLPHVDNLAGGELARPTPSAYLRVPERIDLLEGAPTSAEFRDIVARVTKESGLFDWYSFDVNRAPEADYRLNVSATCEKREMGYSWKAFHMVLAVSTFWVLPGPIQTYLCRLGSEIIDRQGGALRTYEVEQSVDLYAFGLFSIPLALFTPGAPRILENQVRELYQQMLNDGVFATFPNARK